MVGAPGGDFNGSSLGHLLYDESAHSEGVQRRRSYRKRGMIVSMAMLVVAFALLFVSFLFPMSPANGGAWFGIALVMVPLALAAVAARSALKVGFRRVYEGGIIDSGRYGKPRVWLFRDLAKVELITQPNGDTFIGLKLKTGPRARQRDAVHVPLGFASDMAAFPEFKRALEGRVPVEAVKGVVM